MEKGLIINETTMVSPAYQGQWLEWMLDTHIPTILGTGCFFKYRVVKIMTEDESEGTTYAVQFFAETYAQYDEWLRLHSEAFREKAVLKWGAEAISFITVMEVVQ